jgi:hypothetical protein
MWGNMLPGIVNEWKHEQSKPDKNVDGDGEKSGQIA